MVRPRGQGAYPYNSNVPVSVDASVDRAHPGRSGRAREQLPRRCCAEGVRRDPGGGAAEGRLEHEPDPSGDRQPVEALPRHRRARARSRRRSAPTRATSTSALAAAAHTVSGTLRAPLPGSHADRPELLRRRRPGGRRDDLEQHPERRTASSPTCERALAAARQSDPRPVLRGRGLVRQRLCRVRHGGVGGDHVEGARQAGAPADDALGRARLDALRARRTSTTCGPASMRTATSSRTRSTGFGQGGTSIYTGRELAGPVGAPTPTSNAIPTKVNGGEREHREQLAVDEGDRTRTTS